MSWLLWPASHLASSMKKCSLTWWKSCYHFQVDLTPWRNTVRWRLTWWENWASKSLDRSLWCSLGGKQFSCYLISSWLSDSNLYSVHNADRYSTAAKCDRTQHSYGKYLIDLAQLDFNLVRLPSSSLAAAASFIVITLRALQVDPQTWEPVMLHYTTLTFNEIKPIVSRMAMLVLPGGPHCRCLRRKYASEVLYFSTERVQNLLLALHDMSYSWATRSPTTHHLDKKMRFLLKK